MTTLQKAEKLDQKLKDSFDVYGKLMVDMFHYLALFAIGGSIVWSAVYAFGGMVARGGANIDDILLLFIYLELGAMVGIYFKTNRMPIRFLVYVAVTALTRMLVGYIQAHHVPTQGIVLIAGAILLLAVATLLFRFGSSRFPSDEKDFHTVSRRKPIKVR